MKITKSQLKQIIQEEISSVLSESSPAQQMKDRIRAHQDKEAQAVKTGQQISDEMDSWYDDEHETLADRKFADRPQDPDSDADDAAELKAGVDLAGFELVKDRGYYFIVDKESGERVLGPFMTETQAGERAVRPDTRSEFESAKDVLNKLGGPSRNEYMWDKTAAAFAKAGRADYEGSENPFRRK